jgi:hypothetical protein
MIEVNYLGVLFAGVFSMILGSIWYGPLFGKTWIKLMNFNKKDLEEAKRKGMGKSYFLMFMGTLATAMVISFLFKISNIQDPLVGAFYGIVFWIGFVGPVTMGSMLWEKKSFKLWMLNSVYNIINLSVMAAIISF